MNEEEAQFEKKVKGDDIIICRVCSQEVSITNGYFEFERHLENTHDRYTTDKHRLLRRYMK